MTILLKGLLGSPGVVLASTISSVTGAAFTHLMIGQSGSMDFGKSPVVGAFVPLVSGEAFAVGAGEVAGNGNTIIRAMSAGAGVIGGAF